MISAEQACANAQEEVPGDANWDWDGVQSASRDKWEEVLQRVEVDVAKEDSTVVILLYSSVGTALTSCTISDLGLAISCVTRSSELDRGESILELFISLL